MCCINATKRTRFFSLSSWSFVVMVKAAAVAVTAAREEAYFWSTRHAEAELRCRFRWRERGRETKRERQRRKEEEEEEEEEEAEEGERKQQWQRSTDGKNEQANSIQGDALRARASHRQEEEERVEWLVKWHTNALSLGEKNPYPRTS